ncbi:hypothetical protein LBMAG42_42240 [Deltaproteobacteria bacterium]|nr:hypothetical protein LBMAG42_42240 [Deltaproteobacteria bacterium]
MSLIEKMRNSTESTSTRFLIILVGVIFAFAGGRSARGQGCAGGMAATVNGETIALADFEQEVRRDYQRAGSGLADEKKAEIAGLTLDRMVQKALVIQEAKRLGLAVSSDEIAREIKKEELFQKEGKFDEKSYLEGLDKIGLSRADFEKDTHDRLLILKMQDLVARGAVVTNTEVRRAWELEATKVDLTYVRLPPTNFYDDVVVSDADRDAFVSANGPKLEERYKADYERSYNLPKRYHLHTILLRTDLPGADKEEVKARAEAIAAQAKAPGADFAALALRWSEDLSVKKRGDLGVIAADSVDPVRAKAADESGAGTVTGAVETGLGFEILRVESIEAARVIPVEEAKPGIAVQMIKDERVDAVVSEFAARLVSAWSAAGEVPRELTEGKALAVDTTGSFSLADEEVPRLGDGPAVAELLTAVKLAKAGQVLTVPVSVKGIPYVIQVSSREEPNEAEFETQSAGVRARLEMFKKSAFVRAWIDQLVKDATVERYVARAASS